MQYVNVTNRIIECVERRASFMRRAPCLKHMVEQLSLRACTLASQTVNLEIAALRNIFKQVDIGSPRTFWPEGITIRPWMSELKEPEFKDTLDTLMQSYRHIKEAGPELLSAEIALAREAAPEMGDEELSEIITGKRGVLTTRVDQKSQRHLTERDLAAIEMELSVYDPIDSLNSLKSKKATLEGTLRLFANVIWFTGMRPTEVWNCIMMVPRIDLSWTADMVRTVNSNPAAAIADDLLMPVEVAAAQTGDTLGVAARNAMTRSQAPCILMIRSAKTTNQNPDLQSEYRFQLLKRIPARQLNLICLATQCRKLRLSDARKDSIRASLLKLLKAVCRNEERFDGLNVNLYSFRHSFASRAKVALLPHEAAALTGHTARNTLYSYGERNLRSISSSRGQEWLPSPDPVYAEMIRSSWDHPSSATPTPAPSS